MQVTQPMLAAKDPKDLEALRDTTDPKLRKMLKDFEDTGKPEALAGLKNFEDSDLRFPLAASYKRDGIRCISGDLEKFGPCGLSRNFTPIRNKFTARRVGELFPPDFDGELQVVAKPGEEAMFRQTASGIQAFEGEPNFLFSVFDWGFDPEMPYTKRIALTRRWFATKACPDAQRHGVLLEPIIVNDLRELLILERQALIANFEGLIIRDPNGPYKCGRATLREGWMTKWVRKVRFECKVLGFIEEMKNNNEAGKNEFGRTKRSSSKANKEGKGTLGSLQLKMLEKPFTEFEVGTGFDAAVRKEIWDSRDKYLGRVCTVESRPFGGYDKPRFPSFIWWRDESDMDPKRKESK